MNEYQKSWLESKTKEIKFSIHDFYPNLILLLSCAVIITHYTGIESIPDWGITTSYAFLYSMLVLWLLGRMFFDIIASIGFGLVIKRDDVKIITKKQYKEIASWSKIHYNKKAKFLRYLGYMFFCPLILFTLCVNINIWNGFGIFILFCIFMMGIIGYLLREVALKSTITLLSMEAVSELEAEKDDDFQIDLGKFETNDD